MASPWWRRFDSGKDGFELGVEASHVLGGRPGHGDEALERQEVDNLGVGEPTKGLSLF